MLLTLDTEVSADLLGVKRDSGYSKLFSFFNEKSFNIYFEYL